MNVRKLLSVMALVPLLTAVACGGGEDASAPAAAPEPSAPAASAPDLSNAGSINGTITFTGDAPAAQEVSLAADPFCQTAHSDGLTSNAVMVDANGGLMNVVVHVSGGLGNYSFDVPTEAVLLDQNGCAYNPHVIALRTDQQLKIRNSDDTLHNVNVQPANNQAFNAGQPIAGMERDEVFANAEMFIPARCDVHPWMGAFISVFDHPYFGVSGADGAFSLDQLPPGEYVIEAQHETLGTQTQTVTVAPNEATEISISFGG